MKKNYCEAYRNLKEARYNCPDYVWNAERARIRVEDLTKELAKAQREHDSVYLYMSREIAKNWSQTEFEFAFGPEEIERLHYISISKTGMLAGEGK